jgi:hypothetical protein
MSAMSERAMTLGRSSLTGWRGRVGKALARPVAARTGFSEEQVRSFLGLLLLAYVTWRTLRPIVRTMRAPA